MTPGGVRSPEPAVSWPPPGDARGGSVRHRRSGRPRARGERRGSRGLLELEEGRGERCLGELVGRPGALLRLGARDSERPPDPAVEPDPQAGHPAQPGSHPPDPARGEPGARRLSPCRPAGRPSPAVPSSSTCPRASRLRSSSTSTAATRARRRSTATPAWAAPVAQRVSSSSRPRGPVASGTSPRPSRSPTMWLSRRPSPPRWLPRAARTAASTPPGSATGPTWPSPLPAGCLPCGPSSRSPRASPRAESAPRSPSRRSTAPPTPSCRITPAPVAASLTLPLSRSRRGCRSGRKAAPDRPTARHPERAPRCRSGPVPPAASSCSTPSTAAATPGRGGRQRAGRRARHPGRVER